MTISIVIVIVGKIVRFYENNYNHLISFASQFGSGLEGYLTCGLLSLERKGNLQLHSGQLNATEHKLLQTHKEHILSVLHGLPGSLS